MPSGINVGEAFVTIRPDTKGFTGDLDNQVRPAIGGLGKVIGGVAVAAGALGVGHFLAGTISEFTESARVGHLTEAVIRSTGGAANITAGQIGELANALAAKTGVDDETIQSGENVLATFTNVQNKVGEGNDIFSRATGLALDMSQALGTDLQGANIQLGKALNDPIKGITALSRVGVSFTEQQKEQIKTLVESGDTLGAQKVILQELSKEFGGAAEAAADPIAKLKVVLGNAKETIGASLAPIVAQVAPLLGSVVTQIAPVLAEAVGGVTKVLGPVLQGIIPLLGPIVTTVASLLGSLVKGITPLFKPLAKLFADLGPIISQLGAALSPVIGAIAGAFAKLLPTLLPVVKAITGIVVALAGPLANIIGTLANVLAPILKLLAPVIAQIGKVLGEVLGEALKQIAPLLPELGKAFMSILKALLPLVPPLLKLIVAVMPLLLLQTRLLIPVMAAFGEILSTVLVPVVGFLADILTTLADVISTVNFDDILGGLEAAGSGILDFFTGLPDLILGALAGIGSWLLQAGIDLITGFVNGYLSMVGTVLAFFLGLPGQILGLVAGAAGWLLDTGAKVITGILTGIHNVEASLFGFFLGLPGKLIGLVGDVAGTFLRVGGDIVRGIEDGIKNAWGHLTSWIEGKLGDILDSITSFFDIGSPSKLMARKVGAPIVQGIALGMADQWAPLIAGFKQQAAALSGVQITPTVAIGSTGTFALGATGSQAAGRGPITITQHFHGSVNANDLEQSNDALISALTDVLRTVS